MFTTLYHSVLAFVMEIHEPWLKFTPRKQRHNALSSEYIEKKIFVKNYSNLFRLQMKGNSGDNKWQTYIMISGSLVMQIT